MEADPAVPRLSEVLGALPARLEGETVSIGALIDRLTPRSYPLIMLLLAFPNLVPLPAPGLSAIVGLPLAVLTLQMTLGYREPVLPGFLARRRISLPQLVAACRRAEPWAARLERLLRPRLVFLLTGAAERLIGLVAMLLSLVILLPIPFGNAIPALAICLIAVGLLVGDGLTVLAGLVVAALGVGFVVLFAQAIAGFALGLIGL